MKVTEFQLDKLARARELQDEAAKLHIPMPVLSWQFEVKDKNGNITHKGTGKANSYTRNTLNNIAWFAGFASIQSNVSTLSDGLMGMKCTDGVVRGYGIASNNGATQIGRLSSVDLRLYLGTGTTETLDDYTIPAYTCITTNGTSFNAATRKLITFFTGAWTNTTGATIDISEAAGVVQVNNSYYALMIHDVISATPVPDGETMIWTYVTEIAYPNP